jgi:hypothetical protein
MFSPYKLASIDQNWLDLANNHDLADRLREFFKNDATSHLWKIYTDRQRLTEILRHTENIPLRIPVARGPITSTEQSNQLMHIVNLKPMMSIDIFVETLKWVVSTLNGLGAEQVDIGRVFFSKLRSKSKIDLHVEDGKYFEHYDRFHFVVQSNESNIFFIRDEPIVLPVGHMCWINNHVPHWLLNNSDEDRINLIVDARLS